MEQGQRSPEPSAQGSQLPWHPQPQKVLAPSQSEEKAFARVLYCPPVQVGERKPPRRLKVRPLPVGPWAREVECHLVP